jgi:Zn-finger nucleic acid-binding protein
MPCPVCTVPLVMSERQGVEIDYCPQCRGVWLDRGELDKIIERSGRETPPQQAAQHSGYGHKPYKRRKSFLEELFD